MKYIRTEDKIITDSIATHKLTEDICDAGYLKTLKKGANVRISKEWFNYYGRWVDIIDEKGLHYSIRPNEVEKVVKELHQADTIEDLCDEFVAVVNDNPQQHQFMKPFDYYMRSLNPKDVSLYGAIWNDKGLIYVAKMNDKGELELL